MSISFCLWQIMATCGNLWHLMAIYDIFWHFWQLMATFPTFLRFNIWYLIFNTQDLRCYLHLWYRFWQAGNCNEYPLGGKEWADNLNIHCNHQTKYGRESANGSNLVRHGVESESAQIVLKSEMDSFLSHICDKQCAKNEWKRLKLSDSVFLKNVQYSRVPKYERACLELPKYV